MLTFSHILHIIFVNIMSYTEPLKNFKSQIRAINFDGILYKSSSSLPFMNSEGGNNSALYALEILMNIPKNYSPVLRDFWGDLIFDMKAWAQKAQEYNCDILALKFNINSEKEIDTAINLFKEILEISRKPLLITGANKKNLDVLLLPKLANIPQKSCIFGMAEQDSYEGLAKIVAKKGHMIIARTPIDINLAKELNILLTESGVPKESILIDTNMGALGYGLDYGYSIIERVKLAGLDGDEMLNMPIVVFAGEEAWKAKEAKVDDFNSNYGSLKDRAIAWECTTAASILLAGANILVLWHPDSIKGLKRFEGSL